MMRYLFPVVGLLALAVAGCAHPDAKNWSHPSASDEQASQDLRSCRQVAERRAGLRTGDNTDGRRAGDVMATYDRDRMRRQIDGDVSTCMISKGYNFAPPPAQ